mgnify:CR=1 FL=1
MSAAGAFDPQVHQPAHPPLVRLGMQALAAVLAVVLPGVVAAVLFALYHPVDGLQGAALWWRHGFMLAAGLWFGTVFHWRGFGVAAGTHALYDIMALLR